MLLSIENTSTHEYLHAFSIHLQILTWKQSCDRTLEKEPLSPKVFGATPLLNQIYRENSKIWYFVYYNNEDIITNLSSYGWIVVT